MFFFFFFLSQQNSNNSNYLALLNLFNTRQSVRDDIQAIFGARGHGGLETYLGLPQVGGKSKDNAFKGLQEKITKRMMSQKENFISKAGEIIESFGGSCHLYTIPLIDFHLFKITESVISFYFKKISNSEI